MATDGQPQRPQEEILFANQVVGFDLHPETSQLELRWKDGQTTFNTYADLRRKCPCATCRTEREKIEAKSSKGMLLRVINAPGPVVQTAQIMEVSPIGRYALSFRFNDGHQTGIYTYDFLYENRLTPTPGAS